MSGAKLFLKEWPKEHLKIKVVKEEKIQEKGTGIQKPTTTYPCQPKFFLYGK